MADLVTETLKANLEDKDSPSMFLLRTDPSILTSIAPNLFEWSIKASFHYIKFNKSSPNSVYSSL